MSAFVRLAGTGTLADGARLVWSVADGRRGRRWRAVANVEGAISHVLMLEVDLDGRSSRLELTTAAGMLTLHPSESRLALHGNVVTAAGVRHLRLPWSDQHGLEVAGRPIASVVTAHRLVRSVALGEGRDVALVLVTADLGVSEVTRRFVRLSASGWRIEGDPGAGEARRLEIDDRGLPVGLGEAQMWPLELEEPA